jgi:protein-S-isoprenylcysteine O-methyltransferase Ste14
MNPIRVFAPYLANLVGREYPGSLGAADHRKAAMQALAAVTYLIFLAYVANFLMLSAVAAKEAGGSVWLFGAGGARQRLIGWVLRAAFLAAVLWPPLRMWSGGLPPGPLSAAQGTAMALLGHLLVAVGAAVALVSQYHMGAAWRIGAAEGRQGELVQSGPFAWSRNPVFLGQAVMFAGLVLAVPDVVQFLISAAAIVALRAQVRIEERVLARTHGRPYDDYAARVPRWIGRVRAPSPRKDG